MISSQKIDLGRMQSRDSLQKFGFKIARRVELVVND